MNFYARSLEKVLHARSKFPIVALLGPRQSGKTTLVRHAFPEHTFVSLDDPEWYALAQNDPKAFFRRHESKVGIILDEFQNAPGLLSYLKVLADEYDRPGYFVLTGGSHNFLMNEAIGQSLAGRVALLTLLPFSLEELASAALLPDTAAELIVRGGYPRLYGTAEPLEFFPSYLQTYVERDVRQLVNITSLSMFQRFLKLCAARVGQLLNYTDLATQCGISVPTVHQWLSILEASYIIFLLRPHWENFTKRVIKTPKLYFYDTGIASALLEVESARAVSFNSAYGALFENLIIADFYKQRYHHGLSAPFYFWRDKNGSLEVDCLLQKNEMLIPIEIKSGETYTKHFFTSLRKWQALAQQTAPGYLVYGGQQDFSEHQNRLVSWQSAGILLQNI